MASRTPANALAFKRRLLAWFRHSGRDLPWRHTRDPYAIMVSEFMLQQTQVARVEEFYGRFLKRFPTVESLAAARPNRVQSSWAGLGYYRRATNLHALARMVVREHGGVIPSDLDELERLPGVGKYTASAVANFAYEKGTAAVDTNVDRVLRRVFKRPNTGRAADTRRLHQLTTRIMPTRKRTAWEFNQALMDLGATICQARTPQCERCPVQPACRTGQHGPPPTSSAAKGASPAVR